MKTNISCVSIPRSHSCPLSVTRKPAAVSLAPRGTSGERAGERGALMGECQTPNAERQRRGRTSLLSPALSSGFARRRGRSGPCSGRLPGFTVSIHVRFWRCSLSMNPPSAQRVSAGRPEGVVLGASLSVVRVKKRRQAARNPNAPRLQLSARTLDGAKRLDCVELAPALSLRRTIKCQHLTSRIRG